jgi:hypothetical protein
MKKTLLFLLCVSWYWSISFSQNVGIGTSTPTSKLEVHHRSQLLPGIKLVDSSLFGSGRIRFQNHANTRGMELSAEMASNFSNGQYLDIKSDSLTVVTFKGNGFMGIRDLDPSYPLDVNGDMNLTGLLRLNTNAGLAGQVLSSNGTAADPAWRDAAYGNTTRFGIFMNHSVTTGHSLAPLTSLYNLNPTNVTIGANSFTINKTGLYHFDIILNASMAVTGTVGFINFYFSGGGIDFLSDEPVLPYLGTAIGRVNRTISFSMHVTAGTVLSFGAYVVLGSSGNNTAWVYGHLIND